MKDAKIKKGLLLLIKFFKRAASAVGVFCVFALSCVSITAAEFPDSFKVRYGDALRFESFFPVKAEAADNAVSTSMREKENFILKVFGIFPAKELTVTKEETTYVIPGGEAFGVKLYSKGVMVIGFSEASAAYEAGIRAGDMLISLNGKSVTTNEEVAEIIGSSNGNSVTAKILRDGKEKNLTVYPKNGSNGYKSGMWVRDSTAGIGTVSYYMPESGIFAGLGHGITDSDTGKIFPLQAGEAVGAHISSVNKGQKGTPGELIGNFNDNSLGSLFGNTECGIFGKLNVPKTGKLYPVAMKQEIERGEAYIRCTVDGDAIKEYSVTIEDIDYNSDTATKNMVIRITDAELLQKTGGIVRGMSGSPIIQNGKLIGAVTHVFVDDPTSGYAIFAENMLEMANSITAAA